MGDVRDEVATYPFETAQLGDVVEDRHGSEAFTSGSEGRGVHLQDLVPRTPQGNLLRANSARLQRLTQNRGQRVSAKHLPMRPAFDLAPDAGQFSQALIRHFDVALNVEDQDPFHHVCKYRAELGLFGFGSGEAIFEARAKGLERNGESAKAAPISRW